MLDTYFAHLCILLTFIIGYFSIILEEILRVNKTASALLMAALTWVFFFSIRGSFHEQNIFVLGESLSSVSQIIFFLMGAMALVEVIDSHKGFKVITDLIQTSSKRKLLWILGFATFFLSAVLDNLTTTIVMVSLLRKLVSQREDRLLLGSMVVVAANAGGAWTPIGDVTTTMLWINGNITSLVIMKKLILPSLASLVVALLLFGRTMHGSYKGIVQRSHEERVEPGARIIFFAGLAALAFVPIIKSLIGLPPFMGVLIGLGCVWLITDVIHGAYDERNYLRLPHILSRIDTSGVLFFLGILLCIGALEAVGFLEQLAHFLNRYVQNMSLVAVIIGLVSSVIDNVPLVAAGMGMYNMQTYPVDSFLWQVLAFCAGTGGSILIIGSAAGVAFMGMEKVDFMWYFRRISLIALLSYFAGIGVFLLQEALLLI